MILKVNDVISLLKDIKKNNLNNRCHLSDWILNIKYYLLNMFKGPF